jgi:hypothetical protein
LAGPLFGFLLALLGGQPFVEAHASFRSPLCLIGALTFGHGFRCLHAGLPLVERLSQHGARGSSGLTGHRRLGMVPSVESKET